MASTFLNLSTDTTLGGNSPSDSVAVSQKAIKTYVDNNSGGGSTYTAGTGIDITSNVISVTSPTLTNTATKDYSLSILGTPSTYAKYAVNIGYSSSASENYGTAIGYGANAGYERSIQLGKGNASSAAALFVGFGNYWGSNRNYKLLDYQGYIPNARINMDSTPTSASTNTVTSGGVYTALGDKQDTLVSGTNIKTVNNQSLLGSGNITITGGGAVDSVNGYTGIVVLTAGDVGVEAYTANEVQTIWESV